MSELLWLQTSPRPGEWPESVIACRVRATCRGDAEQVLARAKEALERVLEVDPQAWPSNEEWARRLPPWFVARCAPQTAETANVGEGRWTLANWVYWFLPEQRFWVWWNARLPDPNTLLVYVVVDGWPFPWGALDWLLRASGAVETELVNAE
ncbi:MAG TPA: hypothetical protein VGM37_13055 [Armatimonadota bacterium]|jgi:hypothetical protein